MRPIANLLFVIALLGTGAPVLGQDAARYSPPGCQSGQVKIMVLGTYHMASPGLDAIKMEVDDVLSERRQAEITDLVARLSRFSPDKVMVEAPWGSTRTTEKYQAYLADEYELSRNETDQVAFRLARGLGHDAVYPIDYPMFQDGTALEFYKAYNPKAPDHGTAMREDWDVLSKASEEKLRTGTIAEYLYHINGSDYWAFGLDTRYALQTSIRQAQYDQYAGADLLTSWYKRNLRMLTNIHRSLDEGSESALVLVGAGHNRILWELIDLSPLLCRVDPRPYLVD